MQPESTELSYNRQALQLTGRGCKVLVSSHLPCWERQSHVRWYKRRHVILLNWVRVSTWNEQGENRAEALKRVHHTNKEYCRWYLKHICAVAGAIVTAGKSVTGSDAPVSTEWAACSCSSETQRGQARWDHAPRLALARCVHSCHDNTENLFLR